MAYNDLAEFLPQKGGFKTPGQYDRMLKAEATKKAAYLSAMDQFYSQLEETMRQFDLQLGQRSKEFKNMMDLRRDQRNIQYGQLLLSGLGLGLNTFLKNKDITYAFDWMDKLDEEYDVFRQLFDSGSELPEFDLADFDLDLTDEFDLAESAFGSPAEWKF